MTIARPAPPLPVDAQLPQMHRALDAEAMASVFTGLVDPVHGVPTCEVDRVKYRPGHNLSVAYRLLWPDGAPLREQRVSARFCTHGESARRHAKAATRPLQASPAGPALSHCPSLGMVAHWWPNDRRLAAAAVLHDEAALRAQWLPEVVSALDVDGGRLVGHRLQIVQLMPERRVTARVSLDVDHGAGVLRTHVVYAKSDAALRGATTQAVMQALRDSPAARDGSLLTPQPLLWQPGSGLHWQHALPGRPLFDDEPLVGAATAGRVGALVAALHGTTPPGLPAVQRDDLLQRLQAVRALLEQVEPAWAWRSLPVLRALEDGLPAAGEGVPVTLHGDLHPGNVLRQERQLAMIDLDDVHRGPAWLDLGDWCADAVYRALLGGRTAASAGAVNQAFCGGYFSGGGAPLSPSRLAWATAWQLVCRRVQRCIVNLKPGRYALVPALLAAAQGLLAGHRRVVAEVGA